MGGRRLLYAISAFALYAAAAVAFIFPGSAHAASYQFTTPFGSPWRVASPSLGCADIVASSVAMFKEITIIAGELYVPVSCASAEHSGTVGAGISVYYAYRPSGGGVTLQSMVYTLESKSTSPPDAEPAPDFTAAVGDYKTQTILFIIGSMFALFVGFRTGLSLI